MITHTLPGYTEKLGMIVDTETGVLLTVDDDVSPLPDGKVAESLPGDWPCVGVGIRPAAASTAGRMMLRWAGRTEGATVSGTSTVLLGLLSS